MEESAKDKLTRQLQDGSITAEEVETRAGLSRREEVELIEEPMPEDETEDETQS